MATSKAERHFSIADQKIRQSAFSDAEGHLRKAIEINPQYGNAWVRLASLFGTTGRLKEAEDAFRQAVILLPDTPDACYGLAQILQMQGKTAEAAPYYQQARQLYERVALEQPDLDSVHVVLGVIYLTEGDYVKAELSLRRASRYQPKSPDIKINLSTALLHLGKAPESLEVCESVMNALPNHLQAVHAAAAALLSMGRVAEAFQHTEKILDVQPGNRAVIALSARLLGRMGRPQEGCDRLAPLIQDNVTDDVELALTFSALASKTGKVDAAIGMLQHLQTKGARFYGGHNLMLDFELGDLHDAKGDYDRAFEYYDAGNKLKQVDYRSAGNRAIFDRIIRAFSSSQLDLLTPASQHSELPVFIIGMPRSGTTLVEQILSSHPDIFGAGELLYLSNTVTSLAQRLGSSRPYPECVSDITTELIDKLAIEHLRELKSIGGAAKRVIDKLPGNFAHLGLIQLLFPGAKIIHCLRDKMDTCLSCYFKNFSGSHPYAYDLGNLASYYSDYRRLMGHWRDALGIPVYEVKYEELVVNQERISRELVDFCGLEWDDICLKFYENRRIGSTASFNQVRQPMYTSSLNRWKKYEKHLQPLIDKFRDS